MKNYVLRHLAAIFLIGVANHPTAHAACKPQNDAPILTGTIHLPPVNVSLKNIQEGAFLAKTDWQSFGNVNGVCDNSNIQIQLEVQGAGIPTRTLQPNDASLKNFNVGRLKQTLDKKSEFAMFSGAAPALRQVYAADLDDDRYGIDADKLFLFKKITKGVNISFKLNIGLFLGNLPISPGRYQSSTSTVNVFGCESATPTSCGLLARIFVVGNSMTLTERACDAPGTRQFSLPAIKMAELRAIGSTAAESLFAFQLQNCPENHPVDIGFSDFDSPAPLDGVLRLVGTGLSGVGVQLLDENRTPINFNSYLATTGSGQTRDVKFRARYYKYESNATPGSGSASVVIDLFYR